jgi:F-type H+-transporting ATPase subunit epsilon
MSKTFQFQVVAPDQPALTQEVTTVILPGEMGEFGVMAGHMSFLSTLKPGILRVIKGQERNLYFIAGGFAEVNAKSVIVLAEEYQVASEIDGVQAEKDKKQALDTLAQKKDPTDIASAKTLLARSEARLKVLQEAKTSKK